MLEDLKLQPLEERRKQQRLVTMYKIVEEQIPALPSKDFLTPFNANKRKIIPKSFPGYQTKNVVEKYAYNNTRGYIIPEARTEQYKSSFFVRTVAEWNELPEDVVRAVSVAAFSAALNRGVHGPPLK